MNTIKRDVYVLKNTIKIPIEVTKGTDAITFEFTVRDYNLPATAAAVAYAYRMGMKKPNSTLCDVSGNVISFQPSVNFFEVGNNELQIRVINEDKSLISFKEKVKCSDSMGFPDEEEEVDQSLIEQIIAQSGKESGERKAADAQERAERIEADAKEKSERLKEISTERARIDQLTKMGEGSTTGDAELEDIRVGNEGATYSNAGNAVRAQTKDVPAMMDNLQSPYVDISLLEQGSLNNTGTEITSSKVLRSVEFHWNKNGKITAPSGYKIAIANYAMQSDESGQMLQVYQSVTDYGDRQTSSKADGDTEFRRLLIERSDGADINAEDLRDKITTNVPGLRAMDVIENLEKKIKTDTTLEKEGIAADAAETGKRILQVKRDTDSLNVAMDNVKDAAVKATYMDGSSFGELKKNYNVQLDSTATAFFVIDNAADEYSCIIGDVSEKKYIKAVGNIGSSYKYTSLAIFVNEKNNITGYVYAPTYASISYEERYIKVPDGSKTVYINATNGRQPELYEAFIKYTPSFYKKEEIDEKLIDINILTETILEKPTLSLIEGFYINSGGRILENVDFVYTSPIALKRGDVIQVYAQGYLTNVAIISKTDISNLNHTVKVSSNDGEYKKYTYAVKEDGYYCFCGYRDAKIKAYVIKANVDLIEKPYCDLSIFRKFGVVGDSYASGELYYDEAYHDKYFNSWGQVMARKHGTICTNYSSGGLHTRSWLTAQKGLPLLLENEPEDAYYLALGINDYYALGESYLGSIADIADYSSYTDYGDTFYGNYGRIIEQIQNHAPNSKLVMFTCASTEELPQKFNNAIVEIANHYELPYVVQADDDFFQNKVYTNMSGGHPTSIAYSGMAVAFERLLNNCILNNMSYFFDIYMYD